MGNQNFLVHALLFARKALYKWRSMQQLSSGSGEEIRGIQGCSDNRRHHWRGGHLTWNRGWLRRGSRRRHPRDLQAIKAGQGEPYASDGQRAAACVVRSLAERQRRTGSRAGRRRRDGLRLHRACRAERATRAALRPDVLRACKIASGASAACEPPSIFQAQSKQSKKYNPGRAVFPTNLDAAAGKAIKS